jgi:NAD(P)-dependent dehydrogenase (short-subunit alcohol dehydrogenase family)
MQANPDPLFSVNGQSILVAGGTGGLGTAIARELCRRGARVVVADIDKVRAQNLAKEIIDDGGQANGIGLDVVADESCRAAVEHTIDAFGRIDGLVNASGIYRVAPALELNDSDWDSTININLTGTFRLARAAGAAMTKQKSGSIVTVTSVSSAVANPYYAAYAASKAGAAHLTRVLALEWASLGIRVNAIGPATTPTPLTKDIFNNPATAGNALSKIPMNRFGTPDDLLAAVIYLLAPGSAFMTGQVLYVDGGRTVF